MSCQTGPVVFSYTQWIARYPEFLRTVSTTLAGALFAEACLYMDNTASSPIRETARRALILNMVVAHIAQLGYGSANQPASPLVGRVSNAAEGSVSVATEGLGAASSAGSKEWFTQTKYGAAAWQAMAPYRTMRYVPGPRTGIGFFGRLRF